MMKKRVTIVCALSLFLSVNVFAQKAYTLKQNLQPGKKYSYEMTVDQNIYQTIMGQQIDMKQLLTLGYTFNVLKATEQNKNIQVTYNKVHSLTEAMGTTSEYDSATDSGESKHPLSAMKGAGFQMEVTPSGEVKSITGVDAMLDSMVNKATKDAEKRQQLKDTFGKQFGEDAIKSSMEAAMKIYPSKPVKSGESWTIESTVKSILPMNMKTTYTLKEVKDNKAYISMNSAISAVGPAEIMGFTMQTNLSGQNIGDIVVDLKTGLGLSSNSKMNISGTMKAMGQDIKMKIEGENKAKGKEL